VIRGMQAQGIDVLETEDRQGIIETSVQIIQQGTDLILSPLID
jgi:hypothetical protein